MSTATLPGVGLHEGIPMADYLALSAVSASGLEVFRRSPLQYRYARAHPSESTPALERGTALHMAVLEPERFAGVYVTLGQCEGTKKNGERCQYAGSVWRGGASYCGRHDPDPDARVAVTVLPEADMDAVVGMRDAILTHPRARTLFEGRGGPELTGIFEDPETGVPCRFRPDRLVERAGMLVDIKTCRSASPHDFPRDAARRGYHRKIALYRRGLRALGWPYSAAAIVAVESKPPHDIACYLMDESDLDAADQEVTRLLRHYRTCEETDTWPGYGDEFLTLQVPAWALEDDDEIL